jgi:hypothetical protein
VTSGSLTRDAPRASCQKIFDAIGIAVGKIIDHYKMAKHFDITTASNP